METADHYDFEPRERAKRRRKGKAPPAIHDRTEEAYRYVRLHLGLDYPFTFLSYSNLSLSYFPTWAIERALAKLVKDGVLRGPLPVAKTKKGEALWYKMAIGDKETGWITWAEGQWRKWHTNLQRIWLIRRAKAARNDAANAARPPPLFDWATKTYKHRERSRPPTTSKTASLREFMRAMPTVQWDGMAYHPVAGRAMDELLAWREAQPAGEFQRVEPYKARPSSRKVKQTKCRKCGNVFYGSFGYVKRTHRPAQCNLLIVTRIMET